MSRKRRRLVAHLIPGDKVLLRKRERETEIEIQPSPNSFCRLQYKCENGCYNSLSETLVSLFTRGWDGSSVIIQRAFH